VQMIGMLFARGGDFLSVLAKEDLKGEDGGHVLNSCARKRTAKIGKLQIRKQMFGSPFVCLCIREDLRGFQGKKTPGAMMMEVFETSHGNRNCGLSNVG
jgi:hypothetical protein